MGFIIKTHCIVVNIFRYTMRRNIKKVKRTKLRNCFPVSSVYILGLHFGGIPGEGFTFFEAVVAHLILEYKFLCSGVET